MWRQPTVDAANVGSITATENLCLFHTEERYLMLCGGHTQVVDSAVRVFSRL